jgi:hypothetical protein
MRGKVKLTLSLSEEIVRQLKMEAAALGYARLNEYVEHIIRYHRATCEGCFHRADSLFERQPKRL